MTGIDPNLPVAIREAVAGVTYDEEQMRADSGYTAKPFVTEQNASLAEQMCFSSGVSIVNMGILI